MLAPFLQDVLASAPGIQPARGPRESAMGWFLFPALALLVALVLLSGKAVRWKAAALCLLALALSCWWLIDRLSGDGVNAATLYHLRADMEGAGVGDFKGEIAGFLALALLSLAALLLPRVRRFRLPRHGGAVLGAFAATLLATVAASPLARDGVRLARMLQPVDYQGIAQDYVRPSARIQRPRNVVWIYGESLERTYMDPQAFTGLMPHLSRLAAQGLDVRDLGQVEGTGWTIAGMVASMCGVPLTAQAGDENSLGRLERFLPGAACLGDVLHRQGYATRFIGGADAAFAGKGRFLRSHGFDEVRDLAWFRAQGVPERHFSQWGVHDDVLLEQAWKEFEQLSRASRDTGKPFLLSALTMDTHHPAGHLPEACRGQRYQRPQGGKPMLDAIKCSDRLIGELVDRIRSSPWGGDTLVVVSSDHLAMPNELSDELADLHRENLLLFLGQGIAPRRLSASRSSTLDTGATVLQLLEPSQSAIGFGRSLLSPPGTATASAAGRANDAEYPRYLAFARALWTGGGAARALQLDADARVAVGSQRIQPPVLLQYDDDWNLSSITLEDWPAQQALAARAERPLAYVQRCAAFEDADRDGEWCALLVDPARGARLVGDAQLRRGVRIDRDAGRPAPYGTQARIPVTVANRILEPGSGEFMLDLWAGKHPDGPFWVEAVNEHDGRVLATEWVQPDAAGRIRLPLALTEPDQVVRLRAWVDNGQHFTVGHHALMPMQHVAESRKPGTTTGASTRTSRSRG